MRFGIGILLWCIVLVAFGLSMFPAIVKIGLITGLIYAAVEIGERYYNYRKAYEEVVRDYYEKELRIARASVDAAKREYSWRLECAERDLEYLKDHPNYSSVDKIMNDIYLKMAKDDIPVAEKELAELERKWESGEYIKEWRREQKQSIKEKEKKTKYRRRISRYR